MSFELALNNFLHELYDLKGSIKDIHSITLSKSLFDKFANSFGVKEKYEGSDMDYETLFGKVKIIRGDKC